MDNPKIITMKALRAIMMILDLMPRLKTLGKCLKARKKEVGRSTKVRRHLMTTKIKVANNLNQTIRKIKKQMGVTKIRNPTRLKKNKRWQEGQTKHKHSNTRSIRLWPR